jgi:hypothetical protein
MAALCERCEVLVLEQATMPSSMTGNINSAILL